MRSSTASSRTLFQLLASGFVGLSTCLAAVQVSHSVPVPPQTTDWQVEILLPQADPGLGVLESVQLTLNAVNTAFTAVENQNADFRTIGSWAMASVTLVDAFMTPLLLAEPVVSFSNDLAPFDGLIDFQGPSGAVNPTQTVSVESTVLYSSPVSDLMGFVGSGELSMMVLAIGQVVQTGESPNVGSNIEASATVTITYTYADGSGGTGASIGNRVWIDTDGDGLQGDPLAEPGMPGAAVELRNSTGALLASAVTDTSGGYQFGGLAPGNYGVTVIPGTGGSWVATADLDGIPTPGVAFVSVGLDEVRADVDFGWVAVSGTLPGCAGTEYWAGSTGRLFEVHLALLNGLPLVKQNGSPADFGGSLAQARQEFRSWVRKENGRNMANRLSRQLAAYALNLVQGRYSPGTTFDLGGGEALTGTQVLEQATAVLAMDSFTPGGNPNRKVQQDWAKRLARFNGCRDED